MNKNCKKDTVCKFKIAAGIIIAAGGVLILAKKAKEKNSRTESSVKSIKKKTAGKFNEDKKKNKEFNNDMNFKIFSPEINITLLTSVGDNSGHYRK